MTQDELAVKAKVLLNSKHFMNEGIAALHEKQVIFLVLLGKIPVTNTFSAVWVEKSDGMYTEPDDEASVGQLLAGLGLAFKLESDENSTHVYVSRDKALIDQISSKDIELKDALRLYGYPESAVRAFDTDDMPRQEEQDKLMEAAGLPISMPQFNMSKSHASEELEVLKDWYRSLQKYGLGNWNRIDL